MSSFPFLVILALICYTVTSSSHNCTAHVLASGDDYMNISHSIDGGISYKLLSTDTYWETVANINISNVNQHHVLDFSVYNVNAAGSFISKLIVYGINENWIFYTRKESTNMSSNNFKIVRATNGQNEITYSAPYWSKRWWDPAWFIWNGGGAGSTVSFRFNFFNVKDIVNTICYPTTTAPSTTDLITSSTWYPSSFPSKTSWISSSQAPSNIPSNVPSFIYSSTFSPTSGTIYSSISNNTRFQDTTKDSVDNVIIVMAVLIGILVCIIVVIYVITQYKRNIVKKKARNDVIKGFHQISEFSRTGI